MLKFWTLDVKGRKNWSVFWDIKKESDKGVNIFVSYYNCVYSILITLIFTSLREFVPRVVVSLTIDNDSSIPNTYVGNLVSSPKNVIDLLYRNRVTDKSHSLPFTLVNL